MSKEFPKIIYLQPLCCAQPNEGQFWCANDEFSGECEHGCKPAKYRRVEPHPKNAKCEDKP